MAYTRPSATSANASWSGASAYTRPDHDAANASFLTGSVYPVQGFLATKFGTPTAIWDQFGYPEGFFATKFGTPSAKQVWRVKSMGIITRFGTPTTPHDVVGDVESMGIVTRFGIPFAWQYNQANTNVICPVRGFKATKFGTPVAKWDQSGAAEGFCSTRFGTPRAIVTVHVPSIGPVAQFGMPQARQTQRAQGFKATVFGTPQSRRTQYVNSLVPKTRFGTPTATRSNWYEVRGFMATKFGYPMATQRNAYHVGEWPVSTMFGTPKATQTYPVMSIPPVTRFGRPQLRRNTQC